MKTKAVIVIALLTGLIFAGSLKAQDTLSAKYGEDSVKCVMNNSLYYEFFRQWKASDYSNAAWKDAVKPWRWVFLNCPKSTKNIYLHGEKLLEEILKNETEKERKEKYIDTLMMMYDRRIEYFGNRGYVLGKKGSDLYKLRPSAYEETYNALKESVELEGNETNGPVLIYYFRAAEKMVKAGKADTTLLVDIYDKASSIIEHNIKKYQAKNDEKRVTYWENIQGNIELSFEPYGSCDDMIGLYRVKYNNNPEDVDLLKKVVKTLDKKDCTDSPFYLEVLEKLNTLEPSALTAELIGKLKIKNEQYDEAVKFLQQAVDLYEDENDKVDVHFLLANVYFQMKNYSKARAEAYDVLKIRPSDGKIYILIGDMYVASAASCGDNDLTSKAAYWPAVDKYIKAKNVDPSVAELANSKINTFKQYFPATETIFFYDLKVGDSYTVGCWINETTTVRASD
ncbi:MAG: tetratricopeptide repeat protein [Bacteroidales bacterium]|nr:tetratricopeptide repeat protein [Bacteroidales bacterium]